MLVADRTNSDVTCATFDIEQLQSLQDPQLDGDNGCDCHPDESKLLLHGGFKVESHDQIGWLVQCETLRMVC